MEVEYKYTYIWNFTVTSQYYDTLPTRNTSDATNYPKVFETNGR